jgi:tetratricopeptide (TPR) repeat protein
MLDRLGFLGIFVLFFCRLLMSYTVRHVIILLAALCILSSLRAQETNAEFQVRLAQSFEQTEEWERAVALYEELYHAEPNNEVYFEGLQRGYLHLRAYDKAINLLDQRLKSQPINIGLLATLGGIYYESGSDMKADSVWNRLIEIDPKNIGLYRVVASQMMEHRLFAEAVSMYLAGRKATGNNIAFADDLANLYTVLQQYGAASTEFIALLNAYPQQLPFIENRIASFTMHDIGLRAATDVTSDEVKRKPENIALRKLYAWLAIEGKDYETGLEEYRVIDRLSGSNGAELLDFARRASQDESYLIASQAFHDIMDFSQNPAVISQARIGYARTMEDLNTQADSVSIPDGAHGPFQDNSPSSRISETEKGFQNVVQLYESIIKDYPNSDLAAQSFYRVGIIRMERFSDFNGSLESLKKAKTIARTIELASDASMKTAEVYVLQNDLVSALNEYQRMLQIPIPAYQQLAQFRVAELDYFEGKFDSSLAKLKPLASNLNSDLSNDGLLLQYFIMENKRTNLAALTEYAKADLIMRQQKYSEALVGFTEVVHSYPMALLVDDATMKIADLHLLLNQVNEGLSAFQHVVNDMPESILRDRAQMRIAETYQRVFKDKEKAIAAYEQILAKFPNSLYVEQARKRIRQLRGDAS